MGCWISQGKKGNGEGEAGKGGREDEEYEFDDAKAQRAKLID